MKRLRRWIWNGLTVLSLLLSMAVAVLWLRSLWFYDVAIVRVWEWEVPAAAGQFPGSYTYSRCIAIRNFPGAVCLSWERYVASEGPPRFRFYKFPAQYVRQSVADLFAGRATYLQHIHWLLPGVRLIGVGNPPRDSHSLMVSDWLMALLSAPLTLLALRNFSRWLRSPPPAGTCRSCGYDLRASPDRCPECGKANPAAVVESPL